jgi:hypothetical protein
VVVPLTDRVRLEPLMDRMPGFEGFVRCPAPICSPGSDAVATGDDWRADFRMQSGRVVADVMMASDGGKPAEIPSSELGGPPDSCRLMPGAALSACIEPQKLAAFGAAQGRRSLLGAVGSVRSLSRAQLVELLEVGEREADAARRLAERAAPWVTGAWLAIQIEEDRIVAFLRWDLGDSMRAAVAKVLGPGKRFATLAELRAGWFDPLHRELAGDPTLGAPFGKQSVVEAVQMGGWSAMAVTLASAWVIGVASPRYRDLARELERASPKLGPFTVDVGLVANMLTADLQIPLGPR